MSREFDFSDKDFRFIVNLVGRSTGIVLKEHKKDMVYGRIVRRLRATGLNSFSDYCALLQGADGEEEMGNFVNAVTTNLTSFFRESHHFEHLRDEVLKPFFEMPSAHGRLRMWSAGCSSGMEAYSMAMTLLDAGEGKLAGRDAKILATDIDTNMLLRGKEGIYPLSEGNKIPRQYIGKYAMRDAGNQQVVMKEIIKRHVSFKPLNLLKEWPMKGMFDVIFCRNVVIYFDKETQREMFARMAKLQPGGAYLYIGHSENLHNVTDQYALIGRTIYQRK